MKKNPVLWCLLLSAFLLPACDMYHESHVSDRRIQVSEQRFTQEMQTSKLTSDYLVAVAQSYEQTGSGPLDIVITYDPSSKSNSAMNASDEAARISRALRREGVREVTTSILPVRDQGAQSVALISYVGYQASAPDGCGVMQGFNSRILEPDEKYKLGCTVETVFARQIADPSDLIGDSQPTAYTDGRAASNIVDIHRTGVETKRMESEQTND